ncbi:MAG: hypothetical protein AAGD25_01290 [Cyanobacteria bacterium P01_F01_bin.150]
MAYSDFTLATVKATFGLILQEGQDLFGSGEEQAFMVPTLPPSLPLKTLMDDYLPLATAIATEKARSEFLIAPILADIRRQLDHQVSLFSGSDFSVAPEDGLQGFCDYILSASPEQLLITAPVVIIVEAKRENIVGGLGQCIAAMVAAQRFNQKDGKVVEAIYGVVTTGTNWKFLRLIQNTVEIDQVEYFINQLDQILGILASPFTGFNQTE